MKLLIAVAIALLLIGGGAFLYYSSNEDGSSDESQDNVSAETTENASYNTIFARGENTKCTYDYTDESGNRAYGTAYFTKDKMYGDFTNVSAEGTTYQANVIRNGNTQYVWENSSKQGYKTDVSQSTPETQQENSEALDPDQNYEFKCISWTVDDSLFELPSDVEFTDFSEQIKQVQEATQNACSQITDPNARAACESAL